MVFWKLKELFNVQNVGLTTWEGFSWDSVPVQQSMESPPPFVDHRAFARPYEGHWDFCCPTWTRAATGLVSCWVLSLYPGAPIEDQLPAGETCKVTTALSKDSMCWICNICSLRSMHWHATAGIILRYILGTFYIDTSYICPKCTCSKTPKLKVSPIFDAVQQPSEQKAPCNHEMHRKSSLINWFFSSWLTIDHLQVKRRNPLPLRGADIHQFMSASFRNTPHNDVKLLFWVFVHAFEKIQNFCLNCSWYNTIKYFIKT